jgi:beta-lactamase regulating signal transducer with metallopeptidase domain
METISRSLLTFLLNALWQVPVVALVAMAVCRILRNGPASHRHAVQVAALVCAVLLPLASVRAPEQSGRIQYPATLQLQGAPSAAAVPIQPAPRTDVQGPARSVSFARTTGMAVFGVYLLFLLFRLARFGWACFRTSRICESGEVRPLPPAVERVWARCLAAFPSIDVELRSSPDVCGPVAAGAWNRTIVLPEALFGERSEEVLTTAIGHEMAHLARHDFALNVLYELLYVPLSFHPAAWWIRRQIDRTREMACDELVTRRLLDARVYADSIMSIAAGMAGLPRPGYTLGVFDGDTLEERIRRLLERPAANLKRARLLLATGLSALAVCAVVASGLAISARAQSGANDEIAAGVKAYNGGQLDVAIQHFQRAVALDPANTRPKFFLATALLRGFDPGKPQQALLDAARQQYRDVLALEPPNTRAMQCMMSLAANSKQFDEAHDWATKIIQADPRDKSAYYTIGFLDWATAYPAYIRVRMEAGMKMEDPGIIPDAAARQALRARISPQIEDGFRNLQIALQLDPGYSDSMAYINLLYRMKSAIVDSTEESKQLVAEADAWVTKALQAKRSDPNAGAPAAWAAPLNPDGPPPGAMVGPARVMAPPPPPPPPAFRNGMGDQAVSTAPLPGPGNPSERRPGTFWQVAPNSKMSANTLLKILRDGGFDVVLIAASDNGVRAMVGPYHDEHALENAKAAIERAGFRPLRTWGDAAR